MEQFINKINATTKDYRGNKLVLNQRVIENVDPNIYSLDTDLQLHENISKTIIINNVTTGIIFLPDATKLISGWKITIINDSENDCGIYYYNSTTLFTTVAGNKMTELLFLGRETDNDTIGKWRVIILSENIINDDTDKYTTNLYTTTKINYQDLGSSYSTNIFLAKIPKNNPVKSIYIKPTEQFVGVNVKLNIGLVNDTTHFYQDINLNQVINDSTFNRDLFNEIINPNNYEYIIGNFYIPGISSNVWNSITSDITNTITSACYGNNKYVLQSNNGLLYIASDLQNWTTTSITISDLGFDDYSDYSLQYEDYNHTFYIFGIKDNKLCYRTSQDGVNWEPIIKNNEINIDDIKFITKFYNNENNKWFISATHNGEQHIIYLDDITLPTSWVSFNAKYDNQFITNLTNISTDGENLVINTLTATYYSTNNGHSYSLFEEYNNGYAYRCKFINNRWVRFAYNYINGYTLYYKFDNFDPNINNWQTINLTGIDGNINYLLDVNYTNGLWTVFRSYQVQDDEHLDLIVSTDFFQTILTCNNGFGSNDNPTCICGVGSGYLLCGQNGKLSYSSSSSFISLTQGEVEIIIEYADSINPINYLNPIIQGQIMPLGTIMSYPFVRTLPAGYVRLDGTILRNVKQNYPEFYDLIMKNPQLVYTNVVDWQNAYDNNSGNVPKFGWTTDDKIDIKVPAINCFLKGIISNNILTIDFAQYYSNNLASGSNVNLNYITYPYIMSIYNTVQNVGTYNLTELGELLDKIDAEVVLATKVANDLARKVPAGTIVAYAGNILPNGWFWCDGSINLLRSTYSDLFDAIGTIYGAIDNEHFSLPKIDDNRFIEGIGNNENSKTNAGLPNITGTLGVLDTPNTSSGAFYVEGTGSGNESIDYRQNTIYKFSASRSNTIYGSSNTVQPKSIRLRYIIKY